MSVHLLFACVQRQIGKLEVVGAAVRDADSCVDAWQVGLQIRRQQMVIEVHDGTAIVSQIRRHNDV